MAVEESLYFRYVFSSWFSWKVKIVHHASVRLLRTLEVEGGNGIIILWILWLVYLVFPSGMDAFWVVFG